MPKKVGRPKLSRQKVYAPGISIRLVQDEREIINRAVKSSRLAQSEWARKALIYVAQHGISIQ
jgi:hypothetical protein